MKFFTHFQYAALLCCVLLGPGCSDDKTGGKTDGEPTQAPVFTAFSPERGQAGDVITITGSYFGTDASRITVLINSTPAKITGVTDTAISAVVPDECGSGEIRIGLRRSSGGGNLQLYEKTFETLFTYTVESNVSTFAGRTGVTGQHYFGPLLTSCLYAPSLLISDNEDNFYLAEWARGIRLLSNGETSWMLKMYGAGDPSNNQGNIATSEWDYRFRCMAFSKDHSRLWILVNRSQADGPYLGYALRSDGYTTWYSDSTDDRPDCEGLAVNPVDERIVICRNQDGSSRIYFYDPDTHTSSEATGYTPIGVTAQSRPVFSKDGKRLYIIHKGWNFISAYDYDPVSHQLTGETPEFAGLKTDTARDHADGTGAEARFAYPEWGCCDDAGNLYVADSWNHCIRKVTPEGVVTTLAGIPTPNVETNTDTFANGKLAESVFSRPMGICMDSKGNFYVAEEGFADIRKITIGNEPENE